MELPAKVFQWLTSINVMQESFIQKRHKTTKAITLTQQATNAIISGHAFYYTCFSVAYVSNLQLNASASLVGNPGDTCTPQAVAYNWNVVSELIGQLGYILPSEHRQLLTNADPKILVELLGDLHLRFGGGAPSPLAAERLMKILERVPNREGALSVDSGLKKLAETNNKLMRSGGANAVENGIAKSRKKHEQRLEQRKLIEAQKAIEHQREVALRDKMTQSLSFDADAAREQLYGTHETLPVFREFQNRGAVQFCHNLVVDIVDKICSGEAQKVLKEKELASQRARKAAKQRKIQEARLIDQKNAVHLSANDNHAAALMCHAIVMESIVEVAMRPDVHEELQRRADHRRKEREAIQHLVKTWDVREQKRLEKIQPKKYDEVLRERKEEEERQAQERERRIAKMRQENAERSEQERTQIELLRREKQIKEETEKKAKQRADAEKTLYYAEQRAKVIERREKREQEKREAAERAKQLEEEEAAERKRRGRELRKKLQEKEVQRLQKVSDESSAPPSLSAYSTGTGDHSAYFGETIGWQYLTEPEFDVIQTICQARAEPQSITPCIEQRLATMKARTLHFSDEYGKRHPMILAEGADSHNDAIAFLSKVKPAKPIEDVSLGLTLAARQHAIDLAYHGKAKISEHTGSDGSTLTQRVLKYGGNCVRPGAAEVIFSVVRPAHLRLSPVEIATSILVGDGDPQREARNAIFDAQLHESVGVGHALAYFGDKYVVETFVIIFSYAFAEKPVAWMSAAHHAAISAAAPSFIDGNRSVHPSIKNKKDLLTSENLVIGRTANPANFEALYATATKRNKYSMSPMHQQNSASGSTTRGRSPYDQTSHERNRSPSSNGGNGPSPADEPPVDPDRHKKRLVRFYEKYAPHKVQIVDSALQMFDGREDELFFMLIRKYGPEPEE